MAESFMFVVTIVIKLDIESICSLVFFQLHSSHHYCMWFASLLPSRYSNRALPLEYDLSMTSGVLRGKIVIRSRDSPWNLVSTHLAGKTKASSHTTHGGRNNVIQIRIRGGVQFKRSKTNIIQRFIIERKHFISGLNQLVNS